MALLLAIETSTTVCSVALVRDGILISCKETNAGYTHAENLTLFVENIFSEHNSYKLSDIDAVIVSKGPGSYTGLRIGVSTAKGLCYALNKPLIAINTLHALTYSAQLKTYNLQPATLLCPMIDARRMEVYCALYDAQHNELEPTQAKIITEDSFAEILKSNQVLFFGDGALKCKETLSHQSNAVFVDNIFPSAKNLSDVGEEKYKARDFENVAYFEPYYLKEFIAGKKSS